MLVDGASTIAKRLNISDLVIGLTVVAFGISAPELFVSVIASFKGNTDIVVGNVVGSNIVNVVLNFFVLAISATIKPLPFQMKNNRDIGVVIISSLLLFLFMFTGKKRSLDRWEGLIFLVCYGVFVAYLVFTD